MWLAFLVVTKGINALTALIPMEIFDMGFHAFTGNDYVSCFFTKGKKTCWKKITQNPRFLKCFADLGSNVHESG